MRKAAVLVMLGLGACVLDAEPGQQGPQGEPGGQGPPGDVGPQGVSPFTLDGNDAVFTFGNVGIGTGIQPSDPACTLHAKTYGTTNLCIEDTDPTAQPALSIRNPTSTWNIFVDGQDQDKFKLERLGATPFMTVDESGNVGIGTNEPSGSLHILRSSGGYELTLQDSGAADIAFRSTQAGAEDWTVNAQDQGFGIKNDTDNVYHLAISNDGNVGVGTSNPTMKLDVLGTTDQDASIRLGFTDAAGFASVNMYPIGAPGGGDITVYGPQSPSPNTLRIATNGTPGVSGTIVLAAGDHNPVMTLTPSGNVGIGTTDPVYGLDVNGEINAQGKFVLNGNAAIGRDGSLNGIIFETPAPGSPGSIKMVIRDTGNVGIGTTNPTHLLTVNGTASNPSGAWEMLSDVRLKQNIAPLPAQLARLLRLRGVIYEWREPEKHGNLAGLQIGMIAQEVEEVFPEWVGTDAEGYKTLTYRGFEAIMVESLRELKAENTELKGELDAVKERLATLENGPALQHASVAPDARWSFAVLLGAALGSAPLWWRRRRAKAAP